MWITQRCVGHTLDRRVSRATIAKRRKWIKGKTTQTVCQGRTIATPDKTTKCTSTQEIENRFTAVTGVEITEESLPTDDERRNQKIQPQHSAMERRAPVTTEGPIQEAWDRWLGENKPPTYVNRVGLMQSYHACNRESATSALTKMGIPQPEARGPRVYTSEPARL